jgi:caffeoyl-CoA O-methyltransferase
MADTYLSSAATSLPVPVHPAIENYLRGLSGGTDHPILAEMEAHAQAENFPIVGRLVGMFIETMAKSVNARRIFEFGSGYGYSAYWFAKAAGPSGTVICSDGDPHNKHKAENYLSAAGLWERIDFRTGWAQTVFATIDGMFDICYNDADKGDYPEIWQLARQRMSRGGRICRFGTRLDRSHHGTQPSYFCRSGIRRIYQSDPRRRYRGPAKNLR